ncbi:nuclear transport factor 2 family protein [Streptomyces sp. NPDC059866]|uniref:nuclear transport factor 2 family protein n=1 Tax=Streptomyces sp. NPDC059866 TaxID=3346978 RepID=UPI00364B2A58
MVSDHAISQIEIRDLTARFTDAVNRRAPKELADLFTDDGEWHVPGVPVASGREAISAVLHSLLKNFARLVQLTHSGHIDVAGDTATATWYITENAEDADGNAFAFTGVYTDHLVRTESGWRFASRSFDFLHRTRPGSPARWYPHPRAEAS